MDGPDVAPVQPSEQQEQPHSVLATVLAYIFSVPDRFLGWQASMAAEALGASLAARGDKYKPADFNPDVKVDRHAHAPTLEVRQAMDHASSVFGFDPDYTRRIVYLESAHTFNPNITYGSVKGLGQFQAGTWDSMMEYILHNKPEAAREWLKNKGILTDDSAPAHAVEVSWRAATKNPSPGAWSTEVWRDADLNALATMAYADHNRAIIRDKLGIDNPTVGQIYAMHMLGEGDGIKLLQAMQNGQGGAAATGVGISAASLGANHLGGFTVAQVMTTFDNWMASMPDFDKMSKPEELQLVAGKDATTAIGATLASYTADKSDTPYVWGGNSLGPSGGVDCSHWVGINTIRTMRAINAKAGSEVYDIQHAAMMMQFVSGGRISAGQYSALIDSGYTERSRQDILDGKLAPGTLIFAESRGSIIHVAQVVLNNGQLAISESGGAHETDGVHLIGYDDWQRQHAGQVLHAVNPFEILDDQKRLTLENAFKPREQAPALNTGMTGVAFKMAPPAQVVTVGDSYMVGMQQHIGGLNPENKQGEGGKTLDYLAGKVDQYSGNQIIFHTSGWNDLGLTHKAADGTVTLDPSLAANAEHIAQGLAKNKGVWVLPIDQTAYSADAGARIAALTAMYKQVAAKYGVPTIDINKETLSAADIPAIAAKLDMNSKQTANAIAGLYSPNRGDLHIGGTDYKIASYIVERDMARMADRAQTLEAKADPAQHATPQVSTQAAAAAQPVQTATVQMAALPTAPVPSSARSTPSMDWGVLRATAIAAVDAALEKIQAEFASKQEMASAAPPASKDEASAKKILDALTEGKPQKVAANEPTKGHKGNHKGVMGQDSR